MTSYAWNGASGHWRTASDWNPAGGPPTASDAATIGGSGTYTVSVNSSDFASSLTLSDPNATLNDEGAHASLTIGGALTMSDGTLNISPDDDGGSLTVGSLNLSGGTLDIYGQLNLNGTLSQTGGYLALFFNTVSGGTIDSTAGTLAFYGSTLSGVTIDGPLDLGVDQIVNLANGTTVVGSSGSGPGTINDSGGVLDFDNTQTVSNDTVNLSHGAILYENDTAGAVDQVLTLASSVTVDVTGVARIGGRIVNRGVIDQNGAGFTHLGISGPAFTNRGAIDAEAPGTLVTIHEGTFTNSGTIIGASSYGTLTIDTTTFTNSGTIDVANRETVTIEPTTFTTTGSSDIAIGANSSLSIESTNSWTNFGSIMLAGDASFTSSSVTNHGLLEGTGGTGTGLVASKVVNTGTIEASSGTLELKGAVTGKGMDTISAAATLEFGAGVSSAATLGDQDIDFTGAGTLHLLKAASFYGEISNFAKGDEIELKGTWDLSGISQSDGMTTLTLMSGSTTHGFEFVGDYAHHFSITPGSPTTTIKFL
jgi:hypothetical protein